MSLLTGFDFSASTDARVLVLGSMPSAASLRRQQYYAHPRNAFWPIMGELFGFDPALPYHERLRTLRANRVALWDVAHRCVRPGSLDADMRDVEANDFHAFLGTHPQIGSIFFNGGKAETLYRHLVLPHLPAALQAIPLKRLPSTSPAHAGMDFTAKLAAWQAVKAALENET